MSDDVEKLWKLLEGISICMVTTEDDGVLRSRPMAPYVNALERTIHFVTDSDSAKIYELNADNDVALSFVDSDKMIFVSVSGKGIVSHDRALIKELWGPYCDVFFGGGPEDADVAVIKVSPIQAEFWDNNTGKVKMAAEMTRAYFSEGGPNLGSNAKVDLAS